MSEPETGSNILLVEDDTRLARVVREFLEMSGYIVSVEPRGDRAENRILDENPDLVILDIMLPGQNGLAVCRSVRDRYPGPILMLTALGEELDEVSGLEMGADDYLVKPVKPRRLLARIQSLLRRTKRMNGLVTPETDGETAGMQGIVEVGNLEVDAGNRKVRFHEIPIELTTAEFELLWLLATHPGEVLTRDLISRNLRGIAYDGMDRSIDLRITRLRKKLGDDGKQPRIIKSVRGMGYQLVRDP